MPWETYWINEMKILDKTLGVENFRVFYLLYVNDDNSALKRISIDIQNNQTKLYHE